MPKSATNKSIKVLLIAAFICIAFLFYSSYNNINNGIKVNNKVKNSLDMMFYLEKMLSNIQRIESGQRGYTISGEDKFLENYFKGLAGLKNDTGYYSLLVNETQHSPGGEGANLVNLLNKKIDFSKDIIIARDTKGYDSAAKIFESGYGTLLMDSIHASVYQLQSQTREALKNYDEQRNKYRKKGLTAFILLVTLVLLVLLFYYYVITRDYKHLKKSQKLLMYNASLIRNISDPIITTDPSGIITNWNRYAVQLYGYSEKEALGKRVSDLLRLDYAGLNREKVLKEYEKNGIWRGEVIHYNKKNEPLHVEVSNSKIKDDEGIEIGSVAVIRNISQRKDNEEKLSRLTLNLEEEVKAKTTELSNVFERITDAFIALDNDWNYTYVNEKAAEMHGKTKDELLGKNIWELYPKVVEQPFYKALVQARETQQTMRVQLPDHNSGKWFEDLIYPSKDGLSVYYHDITEEKKSELALQRAHERLYNHINNTPLAVVEFDATLKILQWSKKAEAIFGWREDEVVNKKLDSLGLVYKEDVQKVKEELDYLNKQGIKSSILENRNVTKEGQIIYTEWYNSVLKNEQDKVIGTLSLVQDVTARKKVEIELAEAEAKFRDLVEKSMVGVYIIQDNRFVYVNPVFEKIFGYQADEITNHFSLTEFVHQGDINMVENSVSNRVNGIEQSSNYEWRGIHKNGNVVYVEVYGSVTQFQGKPAIIGTLIDITDRKLAQSEIEASTRRLALSNERFNLAAKATNDAIWDWDIEANSVWGNDMFRSVFTIEKGMKTAYEDFLDRLHPEDSSLMVDSFRDTLRNKRTFVAEEFRLRMPDGKYKNFLNKAYVVYGNDQRAYRMVGAMQDITSYKIIQQQILSEKQLSDTIINSLPGVFYLCNAEGKFYRWNKNLEKVTGYSSEEFETLQLLDLFTADEKKIVEEKVKRVFAEGENYVEAHLQLKSKTKIPYHFTGRIIRYENELCIMGVGLDNSERIHAQQRIKESEAKFRMLIDQASDSIFISDQLGHFVEVNLSAEKLTGYDRQELLKMNFSDLVIQNGQYKKPIILKELISGETIINENVFKKKDGSVVDVEISAKLLPDGRFQGIVRDITSRKKIEETIRYSEEKRRLILNAALDAIILLDSDGTITFWNPQAETIFGWKAAEVLGSSLSQKIIADKFQYIQGEDFQLFSENGEGPVINKLLELMAVKKDGTIFPIELTVMPIRQRDEEFFCAFIRDISFRKKAEEDLRLSEHKYRLLFDQNPMPMWMISLPDRMFLDVNPAAIEHYGYSREEFLQMSIKDIRPEGDVKSLVTNFSIYKSGINNAGIWRHRKKDGTIINVNIITHDIIYEGKHAKLVLANDVTERIIAEENLKKSHEEFRQLAAHLETIRESERTHMAREIHDELGQQLTGLKMDISWLNRRIKTTDDEVQLKLTDAIKLIDTTVRTVRRIATELRPSILDDLGLVAAMEWQSEEFEKRSEIKCNFTSNISTAAVPADLSTGIFRIYQESLTNVLRHANATEINASLQSNNNMLILTIADNGQGFVQSEIENKRTLGLLGMKERTMLMGGSYEISSKPGKGTSVIIVVPFT